MNLSFTHGLWMMYLASLGYSLVQLGLLESIFHVTSFIMEVPTGSVADIWGRKTSRLAGRLFFALSLVFIFLASSFGMLVFGFICSALGYNLESGAGEALLYDSLLLDKSEGSYLKIKGRDELLYQVCSVISFLAGGYLANVAYLYAFSLTLISNVFAFVVALFFTEPKIERDGKTTEANLIQQIFGSLRDQVVNSMKVFKEKSRIGFLIIFSESLFAIMISLFFYLQTFWADQHLLPSEIGMVYAAHAIVAAVFSLNAQALERRLNEKGLLIVCPLLIACCLWGIALTPYSRAFYIALGCVEGLLAPIISTYLNKLIPSKVRATILSFQSMAYSMFMIMIFPLIGWIGQQFSLKRSFTLMAIVSSLLVIAYIRILLKRI